MSANNSFYVRNVSADGRNTVNLKGVIANGGNGGATGVELGNRSNTAGGRIVIDALHTYTGSTNVGNGTIVAKVNALLSQPGAFGVQTNASPLNLGFGQVSATGNIVLVTGAGVTIERSINLQSGTSSQANYGVTIGGESADTSTYTGTLNLTHGVRVTGTAVNLTASANGRVNFNGRITDQLDSGLANNLQIPITKIGAGTASLGRSIGNDYRGQTTVQVGTILANNSTVPPLARGRSS